MFPTTFTSKTKLGMLLLCIIGVLYFWLPELGIPVTEVVLGKMLGTAALISAALAAYGFRDAIAKVQDEVYLKKEESPKDTN